MADVPDNIYDQLTRDEGVRLMPYRDTVGKLTIGIGRNLDGQGISKDEARFLLTNDVALVQTQLKEALPWIYRLDRPRQAVLENMAFNMGITGLMGFRKTLASIESGNYLLASEQMMASDWAAQVGQRAARLSQQMATGEWQ